jgi:pimeloyl-ACP methyl ester carboxylesterase
MPDHERYLDVPPSDPEWGHGLYSDRQGHRVHYVRRRRGTPVVLLHGWPGLWYDYCRVIPMLGKEADVVAPDLLPRRQRRGGGRPPAANRPHRHRGGAGQGRDP